MRFIIIYDDTVPKNEVITDIIGEKGFGQVIVKKRCLEEYYKKELFNIFEDVIWEKIDADFSYLKLIEELEIYKETDIRVMHCFSNYIISDSQKALLALKKLYYIDEDFCVLNDKKVVATMFPNIESYIAFMKNIIASDLKVWNFAKNMKENFQIEGVVDISNINNFIQCVTGNFDSRYFNSLKGNEYTITKSSTNKKKIYAEYCFYYLVPNDMKFWFVMPFNYEEKEDVASYTMERLHMADLAIKWTHSSIDENEFEELMDKYFFFFKSRHNKDCTEEEYKNISNALYVDKINDRIKMLKKLPEYKEIKKLLDFSNELDIDKLVKKYFELKEKIEAKTKFENKLVIGHGDPCFANALYNKATKMLKFVDPKGATTEEELWTNPYYDIAKLSHSVCGRYDFFNNALFEIKINNDFSYELDIPFNNSKYIDIFRKKLKENGYDYLTVRLYEASLFLSMLPLHIDNPHKVFGFILNVKNILKEIEKNV